MLGRKKVAKPALKQELKKQRESAVEERRKSKVSVQDNNFAQPLLSEQELKNSYENWMKIAADNVFFINFRKLMLAIVGIWRLLIIFMI